MPEQGLNGTSAPAEKSALDCSTPAGWAPQRALPSREGPGWFPPLLCGRGKRTFSTLRIRDTTRALVATRGRRCRALVAEGRTGAEHGPPAPLTMPTLFRTAQP